MGSSIGKGFKTSKTTLSKYLKKYAKIKNKNFLLDFQLSFFITKSPSSFYVFCELTNSCLEFRTNPLEPIDSYQIKNGLTFKAISFCKSWVIDCTKESLIFFNSRFLPKSYIRLNKINTNFENLESDPILINLGKYICLVLHQDFILINGKNQKIIRKYKLGVDKNAIISFSGKKNDLVYLKIEDLEDEKKAKLLVVDIKTGKKRFCLVKCVRGLNNGIHIPGNKQKTLFICSYEAQFVIERKNQREKFMFNFFEESILLGHPTQIMIHEKLEEFVFYKPILKLIPSPFFNYIVVIDLKYCYFIKIDFRIQCFTLLKKIKYKESATFDWLDEGKGLFGFKNHKIGQKIVLLDYYDKFADTEI